jgi:monoamine oxidase
VVTLPLGVLQRGDVLFDPPLPESKKQAIARVGVGLLNKAYLRFPRRFWPVKADWIGLVSEPKGRWSEFLNVSRFIDQPILLGFNAAAYARRLEPMNDQQTINDVMTALRSMFGRNAPDPTDFKITRWGSDAFSIGSYSYMKTGASPNDYNELARPVGKRLFFAGEHTSRRHSATVHGAYLSGLRVASQVIDRM